MYPGSVGTEIRTPSCSLSSLTIHQVYANYGTPEGWKSLVPSTGVLCFDYVSGVVPPADAAAVGDDQLFEVRSENLRGRGGI